MMTKSRPNWKAVSTASLALLGVLAVAWLLINKSDIMQHKPRVSGLTTLDPDAVSKAESEKRDSINRLRPSASSLIDPIDSLLAPLAGMMPLDPLALPSAGIPDDVQIETKPDRLIIELSIPNLNEASLHIDAQRQSLKVSGEQQTEQVDRDASGQVISRSQSSSSYSTQFSLPEPVEPEGMKTHYEDGKLNIEIPRAAKEA